MIDFLDSCCAFQEVHYVYPYKDYFFAEHIFTPFFQSLQVLTQRLQISMFQTESSVF
jgi:hypothetical protein